MADSGHMTFQRFGRSHHLRIASAEDLARVPHMDEALWVACGAPLASLNCDATFLDYLDTDNNGRLMCFELTGAIEWLFRVLRDTSGVSQRSRSLQLEAINTDDADGRQIHLSALKMLARLGEAGGKAISLEQVRQIKAAVEGTPVSEAGVVLPAATEDAEVRQFLADVLATVGGADHPAGGRGVDRAHLDEFLAQARAYLDWRAEGRLDEGRSDSPVMPLGSRTPEAFALFAELREKLHQYFAQCQAVAFDPRTAEHLPPTEADLHGVDFSAPRAIADLMRRAPLARPRPDGTLDLTCPVNAHYAEPLARLRKEVIDPLLGRKVQKLSRDDWREITRLLAAHEQWAGARSGRAVEPLGPETLEKYLDGRFGAAAEALIAESGETAFVLDNIRLTERLVLYQAGLVDLANNFVSFPHLYDPSSRAMFETGTLVMDGRRFNFSVGVADRAAHSNVAAAGNMFILYVEVLPGAGGEKYEVAVPVTAGGKGNLCVGMRGVFEDTGGSESDARVVQIIENPISLSEAVVSPFQRLGRVLSGKIEAIAASAEKKLPAAGTGVLDADRQPAAKASPSSAGGGMLAGGLLMGGGVAIAALGSAVAFITRTLADVAAWKIIVGIAVAVAAVLLPTSIIALLKLRRRDLSSILAGAGWGINARMRLTRRLGRFFSRRPDYPRGARGLRRTWLVVVLAAVLLAGVAALICLLGWPGRAP